jgi:hypothetical protein
MLLALATAVVAISLGAIAALVAHQRMWALAPVRAFAVIAVAGSVALHLLPETISAAGWWVLAACALGFVAPPLIGRAVAVAAAGARHRRLAIELGYAGVLLHQVGDGLGLGAMTRGDVGRHRAHRQRARADPDGGLVDQRGGRGAALPHPPARRR